MRARGRLGIAAWGLGVCTWMRAAWFQRHGHQPVDREGVRLLSYKPLAPHLSAPRGVRPQPLPQDTSPPLKVTCFINGWCPAASTIHERARRACASFVPTEVSFVSVDTGDPEVLNTSGSVDALFIGGEQLPPGPPPSVDLLRKRIGEAVHGPW